MDRPAALSAVSEAAEAWGAAWDAEDRTLVLPALAGIRRGVLRGSVLAEDADGGTRLRFAVESAEWHLQTAAVVILLLSAFGALFTVVWPFFPSLLPVAPFGALLALGGWFLVVSRLQSSGPEEFLELVTKVAEEQS